MRKGTFIFLAILMAGTLILLPFLTVHCAMLPEKTTEYYEQKAAKDAMNATGAEAELMRLLLGGAAPMAQAEVKTEDGVSLQFSWYGLALAISAALGCLVIFMNGKKDAAPLPALAWAAALALPMGFLGARILYCAVNLGFYLSDIEAPEAMLRIWEGGLCLSGALAFAALAGIIAARIGKCQPGLVLDGMVPGMLVFAAGARLSEWLVGAGYGPELSFSLPGLTRMIHDTPRMNTALLMAAALLLLLLVRDHGRAGHRFCLTAFLYGGIHFLLESLRRDGHMLWGFVHAEMVFALLIALPALVMITGKIKKWPWALAATAVLAAAIILLEFALDRSNISDLVLYAVYALLVGGYLAWGHACAKRAAGV